MLQAVARNILKSSSVDGGIDLHAGDGAGGIPGAEHQPQSAAAGTEIQHTGVFGKPDEVGEHCRIGAQWEGLRRDLEGQPSG